MRLKQRGFWSTVGSLALAAGLSAQTPNGQSPAGPQDDPVFRVQVDAVTTDVIVKDDRGQFIADLSKDEFEVYEDGVKQEITSMTMSHGGRVTNVLEAPPPPPPEGIILPPVKRVNDTSGRIFLFFVDDLHMQFQSSGRVRELFKKIGRNLLHDGDLFGIVSSGPSSIAIDMTYDHKRLEDAIKKIAGDGLKPSEIINGASGAGGPTELRHRAHVAFSTMSEALRNLEKVNNRRKALVWVSEGYDFNPFQDSRLGLRDPGSPFLQNQSAQFRNSVNNPDGTSANPANDPMASAQKQSETFSDADLARELGDITRQANRANTTIYTIDPRGLIAGSDIDEQVDPTEWNRFVRKTQDSMRVLADETGGLAVVNMNDFDKALKRIDAESSDYYILGYYSNNPDPTKRRRKIEVKVKRDGVDVLARTEYVLRPPPARSVEK
ncbi:MAG: VWA domain-containing protein [Vicinamibacterales bacterium]